MFRIVLLCVSSLAAVSYGKILHSNPYGGVALDPKALAIPDMEWHGADFDWPCATTRALFKSSGKYINKHNIAVRGQMYQKDYFFALPRYKHGTPATLVKTKSRKGACSARFEPYPCWSMQEEGKCTSMQSIVDLYLDARDLLWVLDTGTVNTLEEKPLQKCAPKVMVFNVRTNKLMKTIPLDTLTNASSRLQYIVVDYGRDDHPFVYISDAQSRAIIVFDVRYNRGYRVVLPKAISQGCGKRDVLYLALLQKSCGSNYLYFTYLCSKKIFAIKTDYLRDGRAAGRIDEVGTKHEKMVIVGTDNGCAMFVRYEGHPEIYRYDVNEPFQESNFQIVHRSNTCQLATHVFADYKKSRMRVLESNFPDYIRDEVGCGAAQQVSIMTGCE